MGKYNDNYLTSDEMRDVASLIDTLSELDLPTLALDHVQIGDVNGEIVGKLQYADNAWRFHARRHDKSAILGE